MMKKKEILIEKPQTWLPVEESDLIPWWLKTTTIEPRLDKPESEFYSKPIIPRIIHPQPETINVVIEPMSVLYKTIDDNNLIIDKYDTNEPKISIRKLYKKALITLCHLLPKILKHVTIEKCLEGGKKAIR